MALQRTWSKLRVRLTMLDAFCLFFVLLLRLSFLFVMKMRLASEFSAFHV